ncbi:mediator of RNA polymerase II transcription subunit 14 isoform X1 [Cannabis sativa]|uniref:mediator of RNA polymerase II transcription subunit 14 isoform X1 n=1 Tax=Cannabis sativa TaxID=3483 RepID=UPI0029C9E8F4|nr:mediator of RNA polymerase II transcription subunit 14 isoform X1 [Cannabis sativa]
MAADLGQQTVDFSTLVSRAAEESFLSLKELVEKSRASDQSDTEKKINILKYVVKTQQRMLRLNVLAKWCQQVPLIQYCQELASTLSSHDTCFTQAADSLFFMHEALQQARAPVYDVPSAVEVLLTGSYQRLPKCIEDVGMQSTLNEDQQKPALKKLDTLVRSKLLEVSLPKEISEVKISDGTALVRVNGEFKVLVTLGYRGHLSMWRILHLELLVGERTGLIKLEESRRHILGDDLERRMSAADNPFVILYSVLHELCVALVMDTVIRQVQILRQGRWRDAIRFELISDGSGSSQLNQDGEADSSSLRTPGLKIMYWLDFDKNTSMPDSGSCPFIKIEPGPDSQIKCLHSAFVIDPLTGREAEFSLDQSCIDVEKLLLRAICCNRYTRLLEIQKDLNRNGQISRSAGDIVLQSFTEESDIDSNKKDYKANARECEGQEILRVRAYGSSFFTLGINIRTGRYLLRSSQNIIESSALSECEEALNQGNMSAAEAFISLRSKSILHLFSSIGRFLGLEVYEHGLPAVKVPKNILNGSASLLMGFPDCGSSHFLLMQLDKDFKPLFKLIETESNLPGKTHVNDNNQVIRIKKIDIGQMQILEDEMTLSLLEWGKSHSFMPSAGAANQTSESGLLSDLSLDGSMQTAGGPPSSFSSLVDEVFELEKGSSIHNVSSPFNASPISRFGSIPVNLHSIKAGTPSPKWEGSLQTSQIAKISSVTTPYSGSLHSSSNFKGSTHSNSFGHISSVSGRISAGKKLSASKSEQDLASLRSPQSAEFGSCNSMDEDHLRSQNDTSKDIYGRSSQLLSPPRPTGPRVSGSSVKASGPRISPSHPLIGSFKVAGSNSCSTLVSQVLDSAICHSPSYDVSKHDKNPRKRTVSQMLNLIPSLKDVEANSGFCKRRKISEAVGAHNSSPQLLMSMEMVSKSDGYSYGNLIAEANKGNAPSTIYVSALLHVVRHCSLCIKHARLTSQMEALDIPYVEEVGLRSASSSIWFRLPFARGDTWQHICLRLGRPGSMYWDVKINDQHFRDLWELQKGSNCTPWGSGVRIANTSDIDAHIRYDPEGVVLSYQSVETDSIKKLVADIQRLSNARMFALGMRRLLGVRADEKAEESSPSSDVKTPVGVKASLEVVDRLSEQMRRAFRIEAVGLMSLWFSFGSGVVARFVVEWESSKEGCTMHVSPDQLWPHTKFLEDFINGAEVASLLDCIRLTAGPLHALTAATRPARAGPIPVVPAAAAAAHSSLPKQAGYLTSQGLLPSSSTTNVSQGPSGTVGNPVVATTPSPLANHSLHGAAMLAAASRGGPGIVPSSLLPIDVSVVLRGPYWIRIIYRKNFAVDMRCFAGDQVWLQPATPPKGGPSVGGSLPCPQFRPFIMEHVAQELNVLEPNFAGSQQGGGLAANQNQGSGVQLSSANGSRINLPASAAMARPGNPVAALHRLGNVPPGSSNLAVINSGVPLRRPPGTGVPAHVRGELNTAIIGLGDDGGYGGGWVPLVALKKVLRGILKYLGVLWLFAQLPELLKEILGSILKENEGSLLNLDQEQPALRFFVGGYVFAVSVHRVQLLLQVLSVKRFHHQQQQQQQQNSTTAQEELTQSEIGEICDYFSRRVASEPYDASRVASFITLLTLPISVLREFLKLIAWKKGLAQAQGGDIAPAQKPRIELCLENHAGLNMDESSDSSVAKSNIHYDRPHNSVDFALTVVLDPAHIPHINAAGGAAWLPYCVSVRLRYSFGENPNVFFLGMDGSHGGRACWFRVDDWEKCKQRVARTVEIHSPADTTQGRLRGVADNVQRALNVCLQGLRDGSGVTSTGST